ncbi:MAG: hypothetical protein D6803_07000 [Anaerolineae bacterium]|nr:MAG: hypothetical protein D6803_07000 [Anaerolineae bacterium]
MKADSTDRTAPQVGEIVHVACGGHIEFQEDTPWAVYQGAAVAFCTPACKRAFEQDPDPFMAGEIPHPVE